MNLTLIFAMVKNILTTEYGMNSIHDRAPQKNSDIGGIVTGNCWSFISCYFMQFLNKLNFKKILYGT